ncbi:MAG: UvrD-helicase domain-containing protein [Christensenellaceae bacterium]|jgi:DNA helicase-2/ATP-dependent DNA helicase PcrA|nr:UvrD-helicase domain-containing protein [Christensenellaceae bacterium]
MDFNIDMLNSAQRCAVEDTEGPVLVLAGAGSGKTRVLTHRVAHLVMSKGISQYRILAITFTNKATNEMRERLNKMLGEDNRVFVSTFHSLCCTILRDQCTKLGYDRNFSILDQNDVLRIVKKLLREFDYDDDLKPETVINHISKAKSRGLTPAQYFIEDNDFEYNREIFELFNNYNETLLQLNAMDFDDLLYKTDELFNNFPEALSKYQERFQYIHVDEFQDTNAVQFDIVKKLAGKYGNLFVVGDDDQSIYGWRGSVLENILNFDKIFPGANVHKLLRNYRSTEKILEAANNVISNNKARHDKNLYTEIKIGDDVEFRNFWSERNEAEWVIGEIASLKRRFNYSYNDFAILIRASSLSRHFENCFADLRISYNFYGGHKFFDRAEIKNLLAYLRIICNPRDAVAIERIINFPHRGIGEVSFNKLVKYAQDNSKDLLEVVFNIQSANILSGKPLKGVLDFGNLILDFTTHKDMDISSFVKYVVSKIGLEEVYMAMKKEDKEDDKWDNIKQFLQHVEEYSNEYPSSSIEEFLQSTVLASERHGGNVDECEFATITTMHSAKGLEFKVVFIVACEEDIFPSYQSKEKNNVEEERRLMYVAITRAREKLYITNATSRMRGDNVVYALPSRFIREAKGARNVNAYAEYAKKHNIINESITKTQSGVESYKKTDTTKNEISVQQIVNSYKKTDVQEKDILSFTNGARVKHPTYGEGKIIVVYGSGADITASVLFQELGVKKFKLAVAPLELI